MTHGDPPMNAAERHARKQVLLTRIAFTRNELRRDVAQVKRAAQAPQLLRAVVGQRLGASLFGATTGLKGDWLAAALAWMRRYRAAAGLVGALPLLRGGGRWRRLLRIAVTAAGAGWLGWRVVRERQRRP